jgi:hypothetical protein
MWSDVFTRKPYAEVAMIGLEKGGGEEEGVQRGEDVGAGRGVVCVCVCVCVCVAEK